MVKKSKRDRTRLSPVWFLLVLVVVNALMGWQLFLGKVPVAFDYGVVSYEPWKIDYQGVLSEPKKIGHDDIRIFYPQRKFIVESLKKGVVPFWNPYEFSGNVALANSQTAVFYPPFWLFLILPQMAAWSLLFFLIPVLAGWGAYLFLRENLRNEWVAGWGGLVFAYSETIITRAEDGLVAGHSLLWLPWVLYGVELLRRKKRRGGVMIVVSLAMSMLAGWFQFTFYVFLVGGLYSLFWSNRKKAGGSLLWIYSWLSLMSLGLTAFHWWPAYEALQLSPRGVLGTPVEFSSQHLMPIRHLLTLIIPGFFGHADNATYYGVSEYKEGVITVGSLPLVLAILGLWRGRKEKLVKFLGGVLGLALVLGINNPVAQLVIRLNLPIVSTFLPNRWLALAAMSLAGLSAVGLREVLAGEVKRVKKVLVVVLGLFTLLYGLVASLYVYEKFLDKVVGYSFFEHGIERYVRVIVKESVLPFVLLLLWLAALKLLRGKSRRWIVGILLLLTIVDFGVRSNRYWYFSDKDSGFPENPMFSFLHDQTKDDKSRFLSVAYSRITSNVPTYYDLYFPEGVDALYPIWYGEFLGFYDDKYPHRGQTLRIEGSVSEQLERIGWKDPRTVNLLSLLGVRYVVVPKDHHTLPPEPEFRKVFSYQWHTVYEYLNAFPKAYVAERYVITDRKALALERIFHGEFFGRKVNGVDVNEVVLWGNQDEIDEEWQQLGREFSNNYDLEKISWFNEGVNTLENAKRTRDCFGNNSVEVVSYEANRVELKVSNTKDGFVVVNDTYFPGWRAIVDGKERPIYRANYAFRAIPIKKGEEEVVMEYVPEGFKGGVNLSFVLLGIVIVRLIMGVLTKRKS